MNCEEQEPKERRKGPSTMTLSFGGLIAVAGLLASGVATYNSIQNDIAALKRAEVYQERINNQMSEELKTVRGENRESWGDINRKIDRVIEHFGRKG